MSFPPTCLPCSPAPRVTLALVVLALALSALSPAGAADPAVDRLLASQCAQCHGTDGRAVAGGESLAGESFTELYNELREFQRENDREIMHLQAKAYTDDQLRRIALYYSQLPEHED